MKVRAGTSTHIHNKHTHVQECLLLHGHSPKRESRFFRLFCFETADCDSHHNSGKWALLLFLASLSAWKVQLQLTESPSKKQQHSALIWAECCWFYHLKSAFKMVKIRERIKTDDGNLCGSFVEEEFQAPHRIWLWSAALQLSSYWNWTFTRSRDVA